MKKMKSLFVREFSDGHSVKVTPEVSAGYDWVINGEGTATRKWDGTCSLIENGDKHIFCICSANRKIPPFPGIDPV